jgi:hypothetical protein
LAAAFVALFAGGNTSAAGKPRAGKAVAVSFPMSMLELFTVRFVPVKP